MTTRITKTWFDGEKIVTQEIPEADFYKAQPAQEPVAWMFQHEETGRTMCVDTQQLEWGFEKGNPRLKKIAPLYTAPQQRPWVGLTDEESSLLLNQSDLLDMFENIGWYSAPKNGFKKNGTTFIRAIEAKLKEKNT